MQNLSLDERALVANTWYLASVIDANEEIRLRPQMSDRHSVTFQRDRSMTIQLDCNRGTANWNSTSRGGGTGQLNIGRIASTRALCPTPSYGERMAAELPQAFGYELGVEGRTLVVRTENTILGFEAR